MDESLMDHDSVRVAAAQLNKRWHFLDLIRGADSRLKRSAAIAVAIAWVPLAVLAGLRGWTVFQSFLTDYATQSRFLIVLPVLILAAPNLNERHRIVAHHLEKFVKASQRGDFQKSWRSFEALRQSWIVAAVLLIVGYGMAIGFGRYLSAGGSEFVSWWAGDSGYRWLSVAGVWGLFVSYPAVAFLTMLWLWRQVLWTRFMGSIARLDLRLVAAHPDCLGGLGFLEASLRGQAPFCFCIGVGLSGAVANRVFHHGYKLLSFGHVAGVLAGAVLVVGVAPYLVFAPILMAMRRRGMLSYGSLAHAAGEQFEKKWLHQADTLGEEAMTSTDFAATNQLYSITNTLNDIRIVPVSRVDLISLLLAAFAPALPLVVGALPFSFIAEEAVKLLF